MAHARFSATCHAGRGFRRDRARRGFDNAAAARPPRTARLSTTPKAMLSMIRGQRPGRQEPPERDAPHSGRLDAVMSIFDPTSGMNLLIAIRRNLNRGEHLALIPLESKRIGFPVSFHHVPPGSVAGCRVMAKRMAKHTDVHEFHPAPELMPSSAPSLPRDERRVRHASIGDSHLDPHVDAAIRAIGDDEVAKHSLPHANAFQPWPAPRRGISPRNVSGLR